MRIRTKIGTVILLAGACLGAISATFYYMRGNALLKRSIAVLLQSMATEKAAGVSHYILNNTEDVDRVIRKCSEALVSEGFDRDQTPSFVSKCLKKQLGDSAKSHRGQVLDLLYVDNSEVIRYQSAPATKGLLGQDLASTGLLFNNQDYRERMARDGLFVDISPNTAIYGDRVLIVSRTIVVDDTPLGSCLGVFDIHP